MLVNDKSIMLNDAYQMAAAYITAKFSAIQSFN
jgi:hypothetical protein